MIDWQPAPDDTPSSGSYRILRVPPGRPIRGTILSDEIVGAKLHYWRGRSVPCSGTLCDACEGGQVPRWKGYVLLYDPKISRIAIFEFTERAYPPLAEHARTYGTLRGAQIEARRTTNRPNGPLSLDVLEERIDGLQLPAQKDLRAILERVWEIREIPQEREANHRLNGRHRMEEPGL